MEEKLIFISLQLPEQLAQDARVEAAKLGISRSEFIRQSLADSIEKLKDNEANKKQDT